MIARSGTEAKMWTVAPREAVLVVDDEETIRETLSMLLSAEGFTVASAVSGEEALSLLKKQPFNLVITDLIMEGTGGIEVLKATKTFSPETGVIILTGFGDMDSAITALRLGADEYLLKPCETEELLFRINRCLEKQDLVQELRAANQSLKMEMYEHLRTAGKLQEYADHLALVNRELQIFNRAVSHDLQEPLALIKAFAERLITKYSMALPDQGQKYLAHIEDAAARMQDLIQSLLQYARLTSKPKNLTKVDLAKTISDVLVDLQLRLEQTGARVIVGSLPEIEAEPVQMHRLLLNLLSNSLKYHRPGIAPRISIHSRPLEDNHGMSCFQVIIEDNGLGFDNRDRKKIFDIFQRLHADLDYKGTGIGLAICKRIVEQHGGSISASGKVNKGATFTITLPFQVADGNLSGRSTAVTEQFPM
jgi:signal transduction histidine kinase